MPIAEPQNDDLSSNGQIHGTGEMAERTRALDWSRTAAGAREQWPDVLLTTVNLLLASRQPMFLWWGDDLIQFYNDSYRPSLGSDKHPSALGQRAKDCWPEIWPVIGPLIENAMQRGRSTWSEDQLIPINRDGKLQDVYWTFSYSPVRDIDGSIRGTLVVCSDTTAKVRTEQATKQERARLFEVLQQAPAFFCLLHGPDHVFSMMNLQYRRLVGDRDLIGKPVRTAVPEAIDQGYIKLLDRVYQGEPFVGQNMRLNLSSVEGLPPVEHYLDFTYQPLHESDGTISGIIVLGLDVTDRKRSEDALIESEKLAAVGRLASSIAHEINNPLESVTNLLYLVRAINDSPTIEEYLDLADRELRRVAVIANQTLRFHKQATKPTEVSGEELIESVLLLYQGRIVNSSVRVERRHRAKVSVCCFEGEIRQVLSNLIGNSLDAMQHAGDRLILRSHPGRDHRTGREGLVIVVADTGPGMPPSVAEQAFQPFFTTKGFVGTGLGLWISREIVAKHAGKLLLRSSQRSEFRGTAISVFLPFAAVDRPELH